MGCFYTYAWWENIEGYFALDCKRVSIYLFHDTDANNDEMPRYFAFFESDSDILCVEFAESNPLNLAEILVSDVTGDGFDEVIIKQVDMGTRGTTSHYSLYILSGNEPSLLFYYDNGFTSSSFDFGYTGTVTDELIAIISNKFTETMTEINLSDFCYLQEDSSGFEEFRFFILQDLDIAENEIVLTGEVWLMYRDGDFHIDDSIALIETHLYYDTVSQGFSVTGVVITPR